MIVYDHMLCLVFILIYFFFAGMVFRDEKCTEWSILASASLKEETFVFENQAGPRYYCLVVLVDSYEHGGGDMQQAACCSCVHSRGFSLIMECIHTCMNTASMCWNVLWAS